jgi:hypothetical protein
MFERVALILALLMTSAAADNYRSFRTAYASVDWLDSITSTEQCQKHILKPVDWGTCSLGERQDAPLQHRLLLRPEEKDNHH